VAVHDRVLVHRRVLARGLVHVRRDGEGDQDAALDAHVAGLDGHNLVVVGLGERRANAGLGAVAHRRDVAEVDEIVLDLVVVLKGLLGGGCEEGGAVWEELAEVDVHGVAGNRDHQVAGRRAGEELAGGAVGHWRGRCRGFRWGGGTGIDLIHGGGLLGRAGRLFGLVLDLGRRHLLLGGVGGRKELAGGLGVGRLAFAGRTRLARRRWPAGGWDEVGIRSGGIA
jgi:hypothetical protein